MITPTLMRADSSRRAAIRCGLLALLLLTTPTALRGDWIQLRNGVQIHGEILRQTEEEITLELTRGGVSSFDMRLVSGIHRSKAETRKKLPIGPRAKEQPTLPAGIHPRPDAIRSVRRAVPGGSLLLPEDAVAEKAPPRAAGEPTVPDAPTSETPGGEGVLAAPRHRGGISSTREIEAIYRIDRREIFVRVGTESAESRDDAQTDRLRKTLQSAGRGVELHALELHRIAGLTTWVAERTIGPENERVRQITGWVRRDAQTVQVIEVLIPEPIFLHNPYRYRVIPRSFRPETVVTPDPRETPIPDPQ